MLSKKSIKAVQDMSVAERKIGSTTKGINYVEIEREGEV